ncbi:hypothetical protein [Dellaglioa algida]|uniref:hypothetical protein n=1 Tax=Dellaglioa algida TaxID=105612 RepID=UPI0024C48631|nr:hypothetical protein [Dellaglioa algida]MDK1727667.1 hypothetical protein [Dellaglioa algida]MDK1735207.1 hypothetical protein [Dellaglioa algida]MDK1736989.1 hypothetical protein [Dellaglioa algida]
MKKIKVTIPMYIPRMMLNWILEKNMATFAVTNATICAPKIVFIVKSVQQN